MQDYNQVKIRGKCSSISILPPEATKEVNGWTCRTDLVCFSLCSVAVALCHFIES